MGSGSPGPGPWALTITFFKKYFILKAEQQKKKSETKKKKEGKREIFHLFVHSPNAHSCLYLAGPGLIQDPRTPSGLLHEWQGLESSYTTSQPH